MEPGSGQTPWVWRGVGDAGRMSGEELCPALFTHQRSLLLTQTQEPDTRPPPVFVSLAKLEPKPEERREEMGS